MAGSIRELSDLAARSDRTLWHSCERIMEQSIGMADAAEWFQVMSFLKYEIQS